MALAALVLFIGALVVSLWRMSALELISCVQAGGGTPFKTMCSTLLLSGLRPTKDEVDDLNRQAGAQFAVPVAIPEEVDQEFQQRLLRHLLDRGVDINAVDLRGESKPTALHLMAGLHDLRGVRMLLDVGADRSAKDAYGMTPLERLQVKPPQTPSPEYKEIVRLLKNAK